VIRLLRRSGPPIRLETERFVLNSLRRRQLAHISYPWTSDPKVMEPLELKAGGWTLRTWEKQIIKSNNRDKFIFGIEERKSGATIGYETAQISPAKVAILGVVIGDHAWWGREVVVESRSAVLDFLFGELGCARAWGIAFARNFPSIANYLTLGFQHEGTLRDHFSMPGEKRSDAMVFGILREEWLSRRNRGHADGSPA
jgi:[ribosomal protein S5]-alanine N-acetyltransferase